MRGGSITGQMMSQNGSNIQIVSGTNTIQNVTFANGAVLSGGATLQISQACVMNGGTIGKSGAGGSFRALSGATVTGRGTIQPDATVSSNGTVNANSSGKELAFQGAMTVESDGLAQASGNGIMKLAGAVYNRGTVCANGGTVNLTGTVKAGTTETGDFRATTGGVLNITGSIEAGAYNTFTAGTGGTITLPGNFSTADLFQGDALRPRGGTITMTGQTLTNGQSRTISGYGTLLTSGKNQSLSNQAGGVVEATGGTLNIAGNVSNAGTMRTASTGDGISLAGTLELIGGTVSGPGKLTLGGNVTSSGSSAIKDGTLALGGNRTFAVNDGTLTVDSAVQGAFQLTKDGSGTMVLTNSQNNYSGGTTVREGRIEYRPAAQNITDFSFGTGTISLNGGQFGFHVDNQAEEGAKLSLTNDFQIGDRGGTIDSSRTKGLAATTVFKGKVELKGAMTLHADSASPSDRTMYQGDITGVGDVKKTGAGTVCLSGQNDFQGRIHVAAGRLDLLGVLAGNGEIEVDADGTLSLGIATDRSATVRGTLTGTGSVGNLTLLDGSVLSPGNSPGIVSAGGTVWSGAGNYQWQLYDANGVAGYGYDLFRVTGTLDVSGASGYNINLWTLSEIHLDVNGWALNFDSSRSYSWKLVETSGGIIGFESSKFIIHAEANQGAGGFANSLNGGSFSLGVSERGLWLNFSPSGAPVPEPSTALTFVGLLATGGLLLRRRRKKATGATGEGCPGR